MRGWLGVVVAVAIAAAGSAAYANTRRIALVAGNNEGAGNTAALHFAETDAAKVAQVMRELGGVAPDDLFVQRGEGLAALTGTFALIRQQIAAFRAHPTNRVIVVFYFSGHSDGEALELGRDRLTFPELRRRLASLNADVRVVIIDSCRSGALLAAKGGTPGPAFQIRMTDEVASTGEALLTSSAADEIALESREISGSFFTHHLISGLRGAADASGDGRVTLAEAYQYAYAHTIKTTGDTTVGMQHPAYDYRLSGQGELVLSELGKRTATLELPSGFDRIVVLDLGRDQVTAEVTDDTHVRLAVQPGRYAVHASRGDQRFAGQVVIVDGGQRTVRSEELAAVPVTLTTSKGAGDDRAPSSIMVASGVARGVAERLDVVTSIRIEAVVHGGLSVALDAGSRAGPGFRETALGAFAGYRSEIDRGAWSAWTGVELGGGAVVQSEPHTASWSGMISAGGLAGGSLRMTPRLSIALEVTLPLELLRRDDHAAALLLPSAWLGLVVRQ